MDDKCLVENIILLFSQGNDEIKKDLYPSSEKVVKYICIRLQEMNKKKIKLFVFV